MSNVSLEAQLPQSEIIRLRVILNSVDPKLRASLAKDLRTGLRPIADNIQSAFPSAPLSGMETRWGGVTAKVTTNSMARPGRGLAVFRVSANPAGFARLLSITERAGSRSDGFTPQGRSMINTLNSPSRYPLDGRGGRFIFRPFRRNLPQAVNIALAAIDRFIDKFNRS
jgi:hypothetical protein